MSALLLRVSKNFQENFINWRGIYKVYKDNYNEEPSKFYIQKILKEINKKLSQEANKYFKNRTKGKFSSNTNQVIRSWDENIGQNLKIIKLF